MSLGTWCYGSGSLWWYNVLVEPRSKEEEDRSSVVVSSARRYLLFVTSAEVGE
jgi:hypothetical protein